jgi:hypothetical protein
MLSLQHTVHLFGHPGSSFGKSSPGSTHIAHASWNTPEQHAENAMSTIEELERCLMGYSSGASKSSRVGGNGPARPNPPLRRPAAPPQLQFSSEAGVGGFRGEAGERCRVDPKSSHADPILVSTLAWGHRAHDCSSSRSSN